MAEDICQDKASSRTNLWWFSGKIGNICRQAYSIRWESHTRRVANKGT